MSTILVPLGDGFVEADARLVDLTVPAAVATHGPNSWSITHGLGHPAGGTYTEVVVPLVEDEDGAPLSPEEQARIAEPLVRQVAVELYGTAWAFLYPPADYAESIERWGMRLRERVVVEGVEVQ